MSAHTPGPLKVVNGGLSQLAIVAKDGNAVAFVPRGHTDSDANAHLIAAAPALLAALEAWQSLRFECVEDGSPAPRNGCECSVCDTSRESAAAIAKAEGRP